MQFNITTVHYLVILELDECMALWGELTSGIVTLHKALHKLATGTTNPKARKAIL